MPGDSPLDLQAIYSGRSLKNLPFLFNLGGFVGVKAFGKEVFCFQKLLPGERPLSRVIKRWVFLRGNSIFSFADSANLKRDLITGFSVFLPLNAN